jgi:hypothetical protein
MILHQDKYLDFIKKHGVGDNDRVASSTNSYLSYLRSVAKLTGNDISPELLKNNNDVNRIAGELKGKRAVATIRNYCSAMNRYVEMVNQFDLR